MPNEGAFKSRLISNKRFHFCGVILSVILFGCGAKISSEKTGRVPKIEKILVYTSYKWETRWMIRQIKKRASRYEAIGMWYDRMAFNNDELLNQFIKENKGDVLLRVNSWHVSRNASVRYEPTLQDLNTGEVIWRAIIICNGQRNYAKIIIDRLNKDGILQ